MLRPALSARLLNDNCPSIRTFSSRPRLFELPGIQSAVGRQAYVDAIESRQILRLLGLRRRFEVGRCADDRHAEVGADADGHHVLCHLFAANGRLRRNARRRCRSDRSRREFDLHVRILRQKRLQGGPKNGQRRMLTRRDADRTCRLFSKLRSGQPVPHRSVRSSAPRSEPGVLPPPSAKRCGWCGSGAERPSRSSRSRMV